MPKTHFPRAGANAWVDTFYRADRFTTGNIVYVGSAVTGASDTAGYGRSPEAPYATLNYAVQNANADNGDTVLVLPGHAETVSTAGGCSFSVAGVSVRGLGTGRQRGKVTIGSTTATVAVASARCSIENLTFDLANGVDAVVAGLTITAADVTVKDCEFETASAAGQVSVGLLTSAAADRMLIDGCKFHGTSDAGTVAAVRIIGGTDIVIQNNLFIGAYTSGVGAIQGLTTDQVNVTIDRNVIQNSTASSTKAVVLTASATGVISRNMVAIGSGTVPFTSAAAFWVGNYSAATAATIGIAT